MQILTDIDRHVSNHAMSFAKYHGNGNDFIIVVHDEAEQASVHLRASTLCDRHRGIGADGLVLLSPMSDHLSMRVINADGSEAKNCGNGLRCAARFYFNQNPHVERIAIKLGGNLYPCKKQGDQIEVGMGTCTVVKKDELYFSTVGAKAQVFAASIGNEHVIFWFNEQGSVCDVNGLVLEAKMKFAHWQHYNLGFVFAENARSLASFVYERGVGLTQSCGTSAVAAACASALSAQIESGEFIIGQPGGIISVSVRCIKAGPEAIYAVVQAGAAEAVFQGRWPVSSLNAEL